MFNVEEILRLAVAPKDAASSWYISATEGVKYLRNNVRSGEVILYASVGHLFLHGVLVPLARVTPPDMHVLRQARVDPWSQWRLEHASGGGEPDRMYLAPPVGGFACEALDGAQQLVFRRSFNDVDKGPPRTELSQPLVQALDLYWLDEEGAYCRLNDDGDVEPTIRLRDLSAETGEPGAMLVTIDAEQLHRYMAVSETALLGHRLISAHPDSC